MILRDAILAWFHFMLILSLAGCLCAELVLYRPAMERAIFLVLRRVDMAYGALAGLVILSGISRVIYSPKGSAYFLHNHFFWTKMGLFLVVALLSIPPTMHFVRLWTNQKEQTTIAVGDTAYAQMRATIVAEAVVLLFIPLFAALMARGYR